jgi:hypothetical protein
MATSANIRVTGLVLSATPIRSGVSKRTEKPYAFSTLNVLTGQGTAEVTVHQDSDFLNGSLPSAGDQIDFEVSARCNQFGLNLTAIGVYSPLALTSSK